MLLHTGSSGYVKSFDSGDLLWTFDSGSLTSCWICGLMSQSVSQVRIFTVHQQLQHDCWFFTEFNLLGVNVQLGSWHWRSHSHRCCCICPAIQVTCNANYKGKSMTMINQLIPWQHKSPQWQQILHGMLHNSRTSGLKQPHLGNVNYPDAIFFDNRPSNKNDISISVRHWPSMFCSVRTSLTRSTAFPMASSNLNTGENSDTFKKLPWPWQWPKQVRIRARTTTGWPNLSQWMSNCLPLMRLWWHDLCQLGH